jgi:two-component system, LuxR family, sensor kinase FixL
MTQPELDRLTSVLKDSKRLSLIQDLDLVDSLPEEVFDRLTRLASRFLSTPVALVSIVDDKRQFFKSFVGLEDPWANQRETPLSHSFCEHVVVSGEPLIVEDAHEHPLVKDNLAIPELGMISYIGMPLTTESGHTLGSFCVIDTEARQWTNDDISTVRELSQSVMSEIEWRQEVNTLKNIESKLKRSRQLFRSLFESAPGAIVVIDAEGRIILANERVEKLFQYHPDDLIGKRVEILLPEPLKGVHSTHRLAFFSKPEARPMGSGRELLGRREDGSVFLVEIGLSYTTTEEGILALAFITDITERKKMEDALKESELKFKTLFDTAPIAIYTKDVEGHYTSVNADTLTYWHENPVGHTDAELLPPEIADALRSVDLQVMEKEQQISREERLLSPNGFRTVLSRKIPLRDADDSVIGILGTSLDITERKQLLSKLQETNQNLSDFAYVVSHDLKAPLRGIRSIAGWLSSDYADVLDDDGKDMLNLMQIRVSRLQGLIEGVLKYSRVGRIEDIWEYVDLQDVVEHVIRSLEHEDHMKIIIANPLPTVYGGQVRLEQVFQNLLSNSIKFMDKPEGLIKISMTRLDGFWQFRISDNGPGIDERYFDKIFQMFQTLNPRDDFESTGIGLSIVKKIVEMHGGEISLKSELGKGTTFTFTIGMLGATE